MFFSGFINNRRIFISFQEVIWNDIIYLAKFSYLFLMNDISFNVALPKDKV